MPAWLGDLVQSVAAGLAAFVLIAAVSLFLVAEGGKQK